MYSNEHDIMHYASNLIKNLYRKHANDAKTPAYGVL